MAEQLNQFRCSICPLNQSTEITEADTLAEITAVYGFLAELALADITKSGTTLEALHTLDIAANKILLIKHAQHVYSTAPALKITY